MTSNEYAITSTKRRGNQIKIVLKSIARPANRKTSSYTSKNMPRNETSPMLAFFSGPGFESREMEIDLRDLVGININDLDDSLRDIMLDDPKSELADADELDSVSLQSEISTCSSAVTVTLEPVDEEPKILTKQSKPPCSPTPSKNSEPWSCPSSSEAEEELDVKKSGRKSKISTLFSFNPGAASSATVHPTVGVGESQSDRNSGQTDRKKGRRPSLTRRMSPLALGIFSTGATQTQPEVKTESCEKEKKQLPSQGGKMSRKLSLTKFSVPKQTDKHESGKKRRHTDPNLVQKQKPHANAEADVDPNKLMDCEETGSPERVRKVSFNALAPSVEETRKSHIRLEPETGNFKDEDIKLRNLIGDVLRSHMLSMVDYRKETCDRTGKSISKILKTLIEAMKQSEGTPCKVVCTVYLGAVRDQGIFMSTQALWDSDQDNFAAASFRNEAVFGLAVVIATPYI